MKNNQAKFQTVVLMAGKSTRIMPVSYALPKGLVSLFNKPAVFNMLTSLVNLGCGDITFVASPANKFLIEDFANKAYKNIKINVVVQQVADGPLTAFAAAKENIYLPTLLLLGDTDCDADFCCDDFLNDWLGVCKVDPNTANRWCMAKTDSEGIITELIDKPQTSVDTDLALMGLYFFADPDLLKKALYTDYEKIKGEYQLSSAIDFYAKTRSFRAKLITGWRDSGALNTFALAKTQFKTKRYLSVSRQDNTVIKKGNIKGVAHWLKTVSKSQAAQFIPSFYHCTEDSICEEFLPQKTLSEIVNYFPMPDGNMNYIFAQLVEYLIKLNSLKFDLPNTSSGVFDFEENVFDTLKPYYKGSQKDFSLKTAAVKEIAKKASAKADFFKGIVHHNLHFDNIYYEEQTTSFKFDNPNEKGIIFGDVRIDYALLRLNVAQRVCQIKDKLFKLTDKGIFWLSDAPKNFLDDIFKEKGIDITEIKALEFFAAHLLSFYFDEEQKAALYIMLAEMLNEF